MSSSLGKSLQRTKRVKQRENRQKYKNLIEAGRDAAIEAEQLRQCGTNREKNLKSIWETNDLENFLSIADAREEGYFAERNVRVVINGKVHLIKDDKIVPEEHAESGKRNWLELSAKLTIPKRPNWSYDMTATEIQEVEKKAFLDWRRSITAMEEEYKVLVTPYEKNLEVWRQLWRVVERADIVAMILDARNPLIFRSVDFESYVHSISNRLGQPKKLVLLLNKADLLTETQRRLWAEYFQSRGDTFFFFAARPLSSAEKVEPLPHPSLNSPTDEDAEEEEEEKSLDDNTAALAPDEDESGAVENITHSKHAKTRRSAKKALRRPVEVANPYELLEKRHAQRLERCAPEKRPELPRTAEEISRDARLEGGVHAIRPWSVLSPDDLLDQFALLRTANGVTDAETPLMVGLVGYPNVGKSSTINAIIGCKKVVVSATPGKTKHFQTLPIPNERRVALCDCPGLVFPSFASTKEQMVCDGILPVDTATDVLRATSVICRRLPQCVLEDTFNISLHPDDDVDECQSLAERLLGILARHRGYMASHDRPDRARAGKELLKRYVDGKLVYVEPPPNYRPDSETLSVERYLNAVTETRNPAIALQSAPPANDAGSSADYEDWNSEDERAWADVDEAEEMDVAHTSNDYAIDECGSTDSQGVGALPMFFSRPPGLHKTFTSYEYFNLENNVALSKAKKLEKKRKKNVNPQLEEDPYTFVNKNGEVELRIDEDDGVLELVTASGGPHKPTMNAKTKSKRQQRREAKKMGMGPMNPSAKCISIQDY